MGIYGSNSRGVQKDRDLVTQPSFVETQRLPSSLVPGWNTGSPRLPLLCLASSYASSISGLRPLLPALAHRANGPSFVALEFSVSIWTKALILLRWDWLLGLPPHLRDTDTFPNP